MSLFAPDTAVLFKRGDVFTGSIAISATGTATAPLVFGAYGEGGEATLRGSRKLSGWSLHSGQIYVAEAPWAVKDLFVSGNRQTLARDPDSGYLTVTGAHPSGGKAGLVSAALAGD